MNADENDLNGGEPVQLVMIQVEVWIDGSGKLLINTEPWLNKSYVLEKDRRTFHKYLRAWLRAVRHLFGDSKLRLPPFSQN